MMRAILVLAIGVAAPLLQFKASVDVVRVEALVLDDGKPVAGLTAADFVVTDNGAPQSARVRAVAREPIDVAIALDVSGSVAGTRLERLRAGALALVGQLTPADRATLLTFDHGLSLGPRDAAPIALDQRLRELSAQGRTSLVDAATTALVWSIGRDRPMLVIVFSDGRDTASWTRPEQALALAGRSEAVVDAVVMGELLPTGAARLVASDHSDPLTPDERFAADLAVTTGGRVRNGSAGAGLAGAFREALEQFRARYEITYDVTSQTPGWHAVDVRVPARRGTTIHVRRGYQR
ncbi:MAG: VWA domain-containing protein [Vicinamibacteraceae bacterium]